MDDAVSSRVKGDELPAKQNSAVSLPNVEVSGAPIGQRDTTPRLSSLARLYRSKDETLLSLFKIRDV